MRANVWTMMSADEALGYVYLPFSTPSNDFYGGQRPGNGLFGESLVCLDARTGKRVWHFQMVHHGLWDYDLPAAPNLIDIRVNGQPVKAVAQVSKQGFVYVFDRVTGKPIWPIEERPVPQSTVPGERSSPTQPFPTKPAPFDRQGDHAGRRDRLHAGAAQAGAGRSGEVQLRPAVHAAFSGEADDRDARHRRRRELVGRGVRSRDRNPLRLVDHAPLRSHAVEVADIPTSATLGDGLRWRRCKASRSGNRLTGASPPSI